MHKSGTKACEYSAKAADGNIAQQGRAETAAGATEAVYRCACVKEEDKPRAEWKEALTCPSGYSPHDKDINICRVNYSKLNPENLSVGWIQTGRQLYWVTGWLLERCSDGSASYSSPSADQPADTCYFKAIDWNWGVRTQVTGVGQPAYMAVLCLKN